MHSEPVTRESYAETVAELPVPVWNSSVATELYTRTLTVVCRRRRGGAVAGVWVCPLDTGIEGKGDAARREHRLLPYASPWIDPNLHPLERHRVALSLIEVVLQHVHLVELPMDPCFSEVAALAEVGGDVACRHTRMLDMREGCDPRGGYSPTVRNHLRAAGRVLRVEAADPCEFDFARAVVGQSEAAVAERRAAGLRLRHVEGAVRCLAAVDAEGVLRGQAFVLRDRHTAILMHQWFDRTGPRGTPTLLVDSAVVQTLESPGVNSFDFEGSVIPGIDRFMAGFGAQAVGYGQFRWQQDGREEPAGRFG